jgi:hypothetical protein
VGFSKNHNSTVHSAVPATLLSPNISDPAKTKFSLVFQVGVPPDLAVVVLVTIPSTNNTESALGVSDTVTGSVAPVP